jgi:hypothetical protein
MPQSRTPPRQPQRRPPPALPQNEPPELRDPGEGQSPALYSSRALTVEGDSSDPQQAAAALYPQTFAPPCYTIGDEQRDRAAEVEEVGIVQWIDDHDSRTEEEKAASQLQVQGAPGDNMNVVKSGGGRLPNRNRQDDEYAA